MLEFLLAEELGLAHGEQLQVPKQMLPRVPASWKKAARGEHAKSSLSHLYLYTIYNTRRFQKRTSTSHEHSMFRYSYKMTENTDSLKDIHVAFLKN